MKKNIFKIGLLSVLVCSVLGCGALSFAAATDPLTSVSIDATLDHVTSWLLGIVITIAAVMLVAAGFQFATAAGNADKIKSARNMIIYALIGVVIGLASKGLVKIVQTLIK